MKIHALARADYLMDHMEPIHRQLPDELRGERLTEPNRSAAHIKHWSQSDVVMVASYIDIAAAGDRRVVYVEHGAGQSYQGARGESANYYPGGYHPDNVVAYIGPRQSVIEAWERPGFAAGAPICDDYELFSTERVVAITFHWNGASPAMVGVPEAGTAFDHYEPRMSAIVDTFRRNGWTVLGTRHPRANFLKGFWERLDVPTADAAEIRERAQLICVDNSSFAFEMQYLNRDVITLNAPWFRRDVEHGLRFWEYAPGVQVDNPDELLDLIPQIDDIRANPGMSSLDHNNAIYGHSCSDGSDGLRAATWLTAFASELT